MNNEQPIVPKKRNVKPTRKQHKWYSPDKKAEVVTAYLALGNAHLVEALTKVPSGTIRSWKTEQWWKDIEATIRDEENLALDSKLTRVVGKTLDLLEDRLENGDFMYDPKKGQLIRKPVNANDLNKIASDSFDRRQVLRTKREEKEVNTVNISDHLVALAEQFVKIAKSKQEPITIEAEVIHAQEVRSDERFIHETGVIDEKSKDESSQDLQFNQEAGGTGVASREEETLRDHGDDDLEEEEMPEKPVPPVKDHTDV
jgi:hypothetical protein